MIGDVQLNIMVRYSSKRKRYLLKVNKVDFFDLPFRATNFNPDSITDYLDATIYINEKRVLLGKVPWLIEGMRDRFSKAIGHSHMTSFSIEAVGYGDVEVSESVMAELIDLVTIQDIHPDDGLNEVKFSNLNQVGELDEGVLDQLIPLSKKLNKLTVSGIYSEENIKALV